MNEVEKQISIWAEQAIATHETLEEQKEYIRREVFLNDNILKELVERALESFCFGILYAHRASYKKDIIKECNERKHPNKSKRALEAMARTQLSLLQSYMCGNKPIGECTRDEIIKQAHWHRNQRKTHSAREQIFSAAAKLCKGRKKAKYYIKPNQFANIINKYTIEE